MTTPNLDATGHRWVAAMAGYDMTIEYLKGIDNKVANMMSQVPERLDPETVTVLLNHARNSDIPQAETDDPWLMEEHQRINENVVLQAHQLVKQDKRFRNLMNRNWVLSQMNDPVLHYVVEWIRRPRANTNTLDEFMRTRGVPEVDRRYYAQRQKDFVLKDDLFFLNITPSNSTEMISVFVVPARKRQAAIDGCHQSAGYQGCDRTLSLMKEGSGGLGCPGHLSWPYPTADDVNNLRQNPRYRECSQSSVPSLWSWYMLTTSEWKLRYQHKKNQW